MMDVEKCIAEIEAAIADQSLYDLRRRGLRQALTIVRSHAKHPADDDTVIDEMWLRSIGFTVRYEFGLRLRIKTDETSCDFVLVCADYMNLPCCWELWNENPNPVDNEGAALPVSPVTRGQLRCLLAALGVEEKST